MSLKNREKAFLISLQIGIVACAISVSLSQLFLFITVFFFILTKRYKEVRFTPIFFLSIGIFGFYLISILSHTLTSGNFSLAASFKGSEFKDLLLFSAFLVIQSIKGEEEIRKVEKAFTILLFVLIVTGFISIFTQVRLSRLITDLIKPSPNWKYTHHYGDILKIGIHLPIGLMNTHLTFAGIFLFFAPYVVFQFLFAVRDRKRVLYYLGILIAFSSIALLNNARSALFGAGVSILIGFIDLIFVQKYFSLKNTIKLLSIPILLIAILGSLLVFNETTAKTIQPLLGQEKHTDSGRTFIWSSTYPMIFENPVLGIGPGNYGKEVEKVRKNLSEKYTELLFFYEVTQRGHAHNDFLHLAAIAGIPALLFYASLAAAICYYLLRPNQSRTDNLLFYGLIGFFFSGLFQCYFQDDEVVIVFWYLLGYFHFQKFNKSYDANR
ncbi:MAG TPA: O-antigen ligase family protein [Leptospiraceae bacterium]|nr:O-antigen ligase family protein [Leptospiraceae bacterium]HMW04597.1 O-antigen ligase family protein [Leptospiraceae bacterium]HMX34203.1 O-antigen ligase family protein [Leptospiraceae bacterium]HMY30434.1 O-antigen ligase family protein [Leptospiraceae bacterium]HMZ66401.1 O-antigen ligase family protein [Leptospiraceae bacterium]